MLSQWAVLAWLIWTLLAFSFIMPPSLCNLSSALSVPPLECVIASCSPFQFPHGFHLHPHGSSFRVNITSYLQNVICLLTRFSIFPCLPFDPSSPAFTHVLQTLLWSFSIAWCIKLKFLNWPSGSCRSCLLLSCLSCLLLTACSLNRMGCPFTVQVHLALVCPPDWHCSSHVWTPHCSQLQYCTPCPEALITPDPHLMVISGSSHSFPFGADSSTIIRDPTCLCFISRFFWVPQCPASTWHSVKEWTNASSTSIGPRLAPCGSLVPPFPLFLTALRCFLGLFFRLVTVIRNDQSSLLASSRDSELFHAAPTGPCFFAPSLIRPGTVSNLPCSSLYPQ